MKNIQILNKHIHIISDEEIKAGDFYIDELNQIKCRAFKNNAGFYKDCKKIILTTDQLLDGVQAIDDEFLQWFSNNPSCESVEVEKYCSTGRKCDNKGLSCHNARLKIIIPIEEPTEIDDWLNEYGDPEIYKKVERKLELMEAAERFYPISKGGSMWMPSAEDLNKANKQEGFIEGAKWQQERSYSETEVLQLLLKLQQTESYDNLYDWFEQVKKK